MFSSTKKLTVTGLFVALVALGTLVFKVPVLATNGYIHLGDSMIYLVSVLFGPYIGAFASGTGSALADLFGGYSHWALPTFIIKGLEGLLIGYIASQNFERLISLRNILALLLGGIWMVLGYYIGGVVLYESWIVPLSSIPWNVVQAVGGGVLALPAIFALSKSRFFQDWLKDYQSIKKL